jgi:hypothetical protein
MGFIVSQSVQTLDGNTHDSFYVKIENYNINKIGGFLFTSVAHYESKEYADMNFPPYLEDADSGIGVGRLNVSMSYNDEWKEWPMFFSYPLTQSVEIEGVTKTLKNIDIITGSVYSYSYDKLKEVYKGIFGEENIIDKI